MIEFGVHALRPDVAGIVGALRTPPEPYLQVAKNIGITGRVETRIVLGDVDGWRKIGGGPGETSHNRIGHQVTVRADGTVRMCKPLHPAVLEPDVVKSCKDFMDERFVPSPDAERVFTLVSAIYSRPRGK